MSRTQKINKTISFMFALLFVFFSVFSVPLTKADAVGLSKTSITLTRWQTYTLKVTNTSRTVKWSSSNNSIATVSDKGKVTAKRIGTATITAKIGTKKYKCAVTVKGNYRKIYKDFLAKGKMTINYPVGSADNCKITHFNILDIDKNGVPELMVYCNSSENGNNQRISIYTIKSGKLFFSGSWWTHDGIVVTYYSKLKLVTLPIHIENKSNGYSYVLDQLFLYNMKSYTASTYGMIIHQVTRNTVNDYYENSRSLVIGSDYKKISKKEEIELYDKYYYGAQTIKLVKNNSTNIANILKI